MASLYTVPPTPTREQVEAFRKEQHIPGPDLEPWAVESNMVLAYLCTLALEREAFTPPEALRNEIIEECAKAINKRMQQLCSDPEVCYQESDTGATVINPRYSDHVEALDEAEAIVLALKVAAPSFPSPLRRNDGGAE